MTKTMTETRLMFNQAELAEEKIESAGMLYFLEGQYLLRYRDGFGMKSKFLTAEDVSAAFTRTDLDTGWLPAGMVRQGQKAAGPFFVYSAPAQRVEARLSEKESPCTIPIPRTVLLGIGSAYYLWALRDKYFFAGGVAYKAPFPNVHPGGKICWGQFTPPEALAQNARPIWDLFFNTPFNADLAVGKSAAEHNDVRAQLRALSEKKGQYPTADLIEEQGRSQIGNLIERILEE